MEIVKLRLRDLQPSQFYISAGKLKAIERWLHPEDLSGFQPIPVKLLDGKLVSGGEVPCNYGSAYSSVIGHGRTVVIDDIQEKIKGLSLLMKNQTGQEFTINDQMASTVEVIKIVAHEFTAKSRPKG